MRHPMSGTAQRTTSSVKSDVVKGDLDRLGDSKMPETCGAVHKYHGHFSGTPYIDSIPYSDQLA